MVNIIEATPKNIAQMLFTMNYKDPDTYQIVADEDLNDVYCVFEVLLDILMEGFDILSGGLDKINTSMINAEHFEGLDPWFRSIGFKIYIDTCEYDDKFIIGSTNYCKILLNDENNKSLFEFKQIKNNFHYWLNARRNEDLNSLPDIYAVYINGNVVIKIWFDQL